MKVILKKHLSAVANSNSAPRIDAIPNDGNYPTGLYPEEIEIVGTVGTGPYLPGLALGSKRYLSDFDAKQAMFQDGFEIANDPRAFAFVERCITAGIAERID